MQLSIEEVKKLDSNSYQIIDIRSEEEVAHGAIKGALNIQAEEIESVQRIDGVSVNGRTDHTNAPHVVSVSVDGVRAEVMLHTLEDRQIYVSAGSACSSNKPAISSTLKSIGLKPSLLDSTIRFSFCVNTTQEEIDYAVSVMAEVIPMLRRYTRR